MFPQPTFDPSKLCQILKNSKHMISNMDRRKKIYSDMLDTYAHTPLVKLNKIPMDEGVMCEMYAKCEFMNPGGSVKDRIAYRMILDAEAEGRITPGVSVLIEPTSGNTGVGLAFAGACRGYRVIIVMPDKDSEDKALTMEALGAEVIRTPSNVPSDSPDGDVGVAKKLLKEIPNSVMLNQFANVSNPLAHYDTTAEELAWALDGNIDMVVVGVGSAGTACGTGCKIKERIPGCMVVAVDPYGSVFSPPKKLAPYEVEGIGGDEVPKILDYNIIDKWVKVHDDNSFRMARRLIKEEGLLCGGSSGAAMWAALQMAQSMQPGQRVVVIMPDTIRNYMSRFVTDQWMEARNFYPVPNHDYVCWWNTQISGSMMTMLVNTIPTFTDEFEVAFVLRYLIAENAPCAAIIDNSGAIVGITTVDKIRRELANVKNRSQNDSIKKFCLVEYYKVDVTAPPTFGYVSRVLDITPFIVVVKSDSDDSTRQRPLGAITSQSLMSAVTMGANNKLK